LQGVDLLTRFAIARDVVTKNLVVEAFGVVSRFVRKVRTASGAVAVQVVTRRGRQVERIEHVGSAHTDAELALLLAAARERLSPGQDVLDLGDLPVVPARMDEVADWTGEPALPLRPAKPAAGGRPASVAAGGRVVGTSADLLWAVLTSAYAQLGFDVLGDDGFRAMVLARIVEPTSKAEVVRVLDEIGAPAVSVRTLFRSLARSQARDNGRLGALGPHERHRRLGALRRDDAALRARRRGRTAQGRDK
jgi:hypothetical protein